MFNVLCVGGGGMKGVCELGALHHLQYDLKFLNATDVFVGTSIGAVIVTLISIGYTPMQIFSKVLKVDNFLNFELINIMNFKKAYGLIDINQFMSHVEKMIIDKLGTIPTLKELYLFIKKRVIITVTNYSKIETRYFDYENEPNCSCLEALKMSCALPIIFDRISYKGDYYVDGGISDNFPIEYASRFGNVIGVRLNSSSEDDDPFSYIHRLFSIPLHKIEKMQLSSIKDSTKTLIINIETNAKALDAKKDDKKRMDMFIQGYECAKRDVIKHELAFEW